MKRVAETDVDPFYDELSAIVKAQGAKLVANLNEPLPPVPLKGVEKFYAQMGDVLRDAVIQGKRKSSFALYYSASVYNDPNVLNERYSIKGASTKWWGRVLAWNHEMGEREKFVEAHGTLEQYDAFNARVADCHMAFRVAFAQGWNKAHPKILGQWHGNKPGKFVVYYPKDESK